MKVIQDRTVVFLQPNLRSNNPPSVPFSVHLKQVSMHSPLSRGRESHSIALGEKYPRICGYIFKSTSEALGDFSQSCVRKLDEEKPDHVGH